MQNQHMHTNNDECQTKHAEKTEILSGSVNAGGEKRCDESVIRRSLYSIIYDADAIWEKTKY